MDKKKLIDYLGGYELAWQKLGYKSIGCVYNLPDTIEGGKLTAIIRRMKAERIDVPKEWINLGVRVDEQGV